jgi:hypothetical protein
VGPPREVCLFFVFCLLFVVFLFFFALFIDLLTDKAQPLSRCECESCGAGDGGGGLHWAEPTTGRVGGRSGVVDFGTFGRRFGGTEVNGSFCFARFSFLTDFVPLYLLIVSGTRSHGIKDDFKQIMNVLNRRPTTSQELVAAEE